MATGKIKHTFSDLEYEGNHSPYYNAWTAPYDGIAIVRAVWNTSGTDGYWYIKDQTANMTVCQVSTTDSNGLGASASFPIVKGHTYASDAASSVSEAFMYCYKFT